MRYGWDPVKAEINRRKGRPAFELGAAACDDPNAITRFDAAHSVDEDRFQVIGLAANRVLFVVYTMRKSDTLTWIISVRKATPSERKAYDQR